MVKGIINFIFVSLYQYYSYEHDGKRIKTSKRNCRFSGWLEFPKFHEPPPPISVVLCREETEIALWNCFTVQVSIKSQWPISCISNVVVKALNQCSWDLDSISCTAINPLGRGDLLFSSSYLLFLNLLKKYSIFSELEDYVVIIPIMYS